MLQLFFIQFAAWFHLPSFKLPTLREFVAEQSAQDAFEYLLVIGVVVVAVVGGMAFAPGFFTDIITAVQNAVIGAITKVTTG